MSSAGKRERFTYESRPSGVTSTTATWLAAQGIIPEPPPVSRLTGKQITVSESHPKSRDGSYREGGPFYTSRVTDYLDPAHIVNAHFQSNGLFYSGPVWGAAPTTKEKENIGYGNIKSAFGDKNESQLLIDGTNAISYSDPINPASDLGTGLAETFREGVPSLPGIQLWQSKTSVLKGLGSEYLNYQFGWAPLQDEVHSVVKAARHHRDLLKQYQRGEGSNTHRRFEFPTKRSVSSLPLVENPIKWEGLPKERPDKLATRQVFLVKETKKWFEGCFTYGLPSSSDNWRKALGFGSDADQLYGISLSPEILWELTPWSWAVDWFSNAGEVINNVTRFGLAGLVLRYGYIMEESIENVYAEGRGPTCITSTFVNKTGKNPTWEDGSTYPGTYKVGTESVTKRRFPASPFGFSVGWEGLSPTQLAITAALGITRLL